jgi:hypothetical protein
MRRFFLFVLLGLAIGVPQAMAQQVSLSLPAETPEPVDLTGVVTYETQLPALGEVLPDPLAVTDSELAGVGSLGGDGLTLSSLGSPADFVVDDDLAQCPDADFTTAAGIQLAVAAATPGNVIRVCPSMYTPVNVNKAVTIEAPRQHGNATQCPASLAPDPTKDAVIDAGNTATSGLTLAANDIVIYGLWVQNTSGNTGIYTVPTFSGYQLLFNVVQFNTFGLYFNASGVTESLAERNCFRFNNKPGSASGDGIYSDQGLTNARIEENFFTGNNSAAIVMALNQQDIEILHNDVINDNAIVLVDTTDALVAYNHVVNSGGSGIFTGGGVTDTVIPYNLIDNPGGTGINANVAFVPVPNQLVIEKNHVTSAAFDGIRLNMTILSTVAGNKSERNVRDGIRLQNDSDFNTVSNNLSRDNGRDGMRVDGGVQSNDNTIEQNKMLGNIEHDCHDDTVGTGTAGTANFWINDIGKTENRPGLCKNATVTPR